MADPVYQGLSNHYADYGQTSGTTAQVTFPTITADELVLVWVQRDAYTDITGVTLGGQAMTEIKRIVPGFFAGGLWACKASSGGTNVVATATWSSSDNWRTMVGIRYSNVNSATPLQSACNTTGCNGLSGPSTNRTFESITTTQRAMVFAVGSDWDNYNTHTAANGYTKRHDNAIAGGGSTSTIFMLEKVVDSGTYGGTEVVSTAASDQWLGAILSFEPTGGATLKTGSDTPSVSVTEGKTLLSTSSRTDTPTVSLTETSALLGLPAVADSPAVSLTEASSLLVAVPGADTPSISVTEAKTLVSTSDRTDTPTISVVESATVFKDIAVSDTPTLTLTESSTVVGPVTQQTGADTPTISLTEASSVFSQTTIEDTPSVSVVEAQTSFVTSAIADTPTISLAELSAILASFTRTDTVSISLVESSSKVTIDGFSGTDAPTLTLVEVALLAQYDGDWVPEDPGVPGWGEEGSISDPWTIEPSTTSPWS